MYTCIMHTQMYIHHYMLIFDGWYILMNIPLGNILPFG